MALITMQFHSQTLGKQTSLAIILPDEAPPPFKTLYLLHGWSDDHSAWLRQTSIERYAIREQIAVVMPNVDLSFYTDMVYGSPYFTFLANELPERLARLFPLSDKREDQFVAGLSMGGFGAFKWALHNTERFQAAASFSGALDLKSLLEAPIPERIPHMKAVFGESLSLHQSGGDLIALLKTSIAEKIKLPHLYQYCGTEDFLYDINTSFLEETRQVGASLVYSEGPGGHTWDYWDRCIDNWLLSLRKDGLLK